MKLRVSKYYTHHSSYVAKVHDKFRDFLAGRGYEVQKGEISRDLWLRRKYRSIGEGFTIETTLRERHGNTLTLIINSKKCPLRSLLKNGSLEESFPDFKFFLDQ